MLWHTVGLSVFVCWEQLPAVAGKEVDESGEGEPKHELQAIKSK